MQKIMHFQIFHACGLTLNDHMFIFGGQIEKRQVGFIGCPENCATVKLF